MCVFVHSHFSLRYGVLKPSEIVDLAIKQGYSKVCLADINNTSGVLECVRIAQGKGVEIIPGVDFRNGDEQQFVGVARNNEGFKELNEFLSNHLHFQTSFPERAPNFRHVAIIYPFKGEVFTRLNENEYQGIAVEDLSKIIWKLNKVDTSSMLTYHQATFRNKRDFNTHRLLRAVDHNTLLSKLGVDQQALEENKYYSVSDLEKTYEQVPQLLNRTSDLFQECHFNFQFQENNNLSVFYKTKEQDIKKLRELCESGIPFRYDEETPELRNRIEKEIDIITQKGFVSYFLINWDMLVYAREQGYYYVGRGSGANSIVAYLLRITDVDPIELDLYFERFINLYRENPPDFDIDFSWKERDDIYEYLFKKYDHISLLATYNTFQKKGVVRELGKVFGMPKHEIDILSGDKYGEVKRDSLAELVLKYEREIRGKVNHLSIHAGGVLIANDSLHHFSATFLPPKGLPTVQLDMHIAEDVGLYKFDILSQRGLAKVHDAVALIRSNHPDAKLIDLQKVQLLKTDSKTLSLLKEGEAIGCFYVESPAMRMLFKKLGVRDYLGLVAASSIIRPGVAQSGMMQEYIKRYNNPGLLKDVSPVMLSIMPETYGVMVYQEDVIKVAHHYAKLTLAESDVLRRGMSGKYRGREEFLRVENKYFSNCKKEGYPEAEYKDVWRQIESFAGYAFSKGHSASYAVESFQALYLKAHFPVEYMVATINNGGGFYSVETYLHELRKCGATVHAPCVNRSSHLAELIGCDVFLGFGFVESIQVKTSFAIVEGREKNGEYLSFEDFTSRVNVDFEQLVKLINIDAFRFTGRNSRELLLQAYQTVKGRVKQEMTLGLEAEKQFECPRLKVSWQEKAFDQLELLGYFLCSPFSLLKDKVHSGLTVRKLPNHLNKRVTIYGYLVSIKNTKTIHSDRMNFGTFLDLEGDFLDTVHFPDVARYYRFKGRGVYKIVGFVREEFDYYTLEVSSMFKLPYVDDPRFV